MQAVDFQGQLNEYFFDPNRKIPNAHLNSVCKSRQPGACRYISLSAPGYICVKNTPMKQVLDEQVHKNLMVATGDNCQGLGDLKSEKKDSKIK